MTIIETAGRGRKSPGDAQTTTEFRELAGIIRRAGFLRRRYGYYWTKLVGLPLLLAAGIVVFVWIGETWWQLFTAAGLALLFTQIAFLGHDAAHRQIFVSRKWNDWVSLLIGDLLVGMSYGWWQDKHTRHHADPNRVGADPDIELPVLALTPDQRHVPRSAVAAWILAHQGVFFFPLLLLEGVSLHASGIRRVSVRGHLSRRWAEIGLLGLRLIGFTTLVFLVLSPDIAFVFLAVQLGVFGIYMGVSFAPNHKGMPIVPRGVEIDFLRRQVLMSRNVRGTRILDIAMGGLNYQIEHHLFPSMPRPHLRRAAPVVAAYCREHGVSYTETGLLQSYGIVARYINRVGLGERDVFTCPLAQERLHLTVPA